MNNSKSSSMTRKTQNNISKQRKNRDWSQDTLAERVNMSVTQLSRRERGVSTLTQARITAFAQVFKFEPYELFRDAMSKEKIELNLMRDVIVQLEKIQRLAPEGSTTKYKPLPSPWRPGPRVQPRFIVSFPLKVAMKTPRFPPRDE